MDVYTIATIVIRAVNLLLWVLVAEHLLPHGPDSRLERGLLISVVVIGMGVLFLGALAPALLPPEIARLVYTAFTAYAAIIALAILTGPDRT